MIVLKRYYRVCAELAESRQVFNELALFILLDICPN